MTKLEVFNMALAHIDKPALDSTDGTTEAHVQCNAFWDTVRQLFLKQSKLHLARKEIGLALASGETSERYDYVYALPVDCLHPIKIWAGSESGTPIKYVIEAHSSGTSKVVKTDELTPTLIYMIDIDHVPMYNPDDIIAMSYLLAVYIGNPLKGEDIQRTNALEQKYIFALGEAKANDGNMQSVDKMDVDNQFNGFETART
jgi:hypothetical protein